MKLKNNFFYTLREDAKDEDSISSNLLVRSGMIKKIASGIYIFMPLGYKVLKNIEQIIREEMNKTGALELYMADMLPTEVFEKSGRINSFGDSLFKLNDRYNKKYVLGPTHEEFFAIAASMHVKSYKDLPFSLYQFQTKFRDEARPRYGLIRVREFIMKDAYSFDVDLNGLDKSYQKMFDAYKNAFDRMGIDYKIVKADTGAMGGLLSEEFQAVTDIGEDILVLCDSCDYASNIEVSECVTEKVEKKVELLPKELIETKNAKTIEEVSHFLNEDKSKFVKTLIYQVDGNPYACLVKGDDDVNETKLRKLLNANDVSLATSDIVESVTQADVGFAGPIGLKIPVIIDKEVSNMTNFIVGANESDYHYKNVNLNDFDYNYVEDIRNIKEGDICPKCGGKIYFKKGIEIGNTFKLGTKYTEALNVNYLDQNNTLHPVVMGSYGIGLGRCMATLVEQNNDEKGIIWPICIAPFKVGIVLINNSNDKQLKIANEIYDNLEKMGIECLLDDRDERAGVKFNDMDLIGIPIRITVGNKVEENIVELKLRNGNEIKDVNIDEIYGYINELLNER
ncbi:MAG TPA: proline--tRNA ligase [Mollicutes bacterium]|nr:proline--tRNA ligase [Mollicutes bacterium]